MVRLIKVASEQLDDTEDVGLYQEVQHWSLLLEGQILNRKK